MAVGVISSRKKPKAISPLRLLHVIVILWGFFFYTLKFHSGLLWCDTEYFVNSQSLKTQLSMFQKSSMSYSLILFICSSAFFISGFLLIEKSTLDGTSKFIPILVSLSFTSSQLLKASKITGL